MSYAQFSKEERFKLEAYLLAGFDQKECALRLSRSESTISREIWRNSDPITGHYDARAAHQRTRKRRRKPDKVLASNPKLAEDIVDMLISDYWSPDEIAGVLKKQGIAIHFMTIYRWIYDERRDLIPFLRHGKKYRWRRKRGTKIRELQRELGKKRWIHERPTVIEARRRIGDWEGDTVLGSEKIERIATYVDRKSGYLIARRTSALAQDFRIQTKIAFKKIPKKKKIHSPSTTDRKWQSMNSSSEIPEQPYTLHTHTVRMSEGRMKIPMDSYESSFQRKHRLLM